MISDIILGPQIDLFSLFWVIVNSLEEMGSQSSLRL